MLKQAIKSQLEELLLTPLQAGDRVIVFMLSQINYLQEPDPYGSR